ncbi:MAG: pitrilysin family protein [Candidatus Omnitrophica bacterium]|nr:pitrilysin family protein [Candidatus Omnitrophota bacterium]
MKQEYKKTTLSNNLKIVTHSMPGMQSVALGIWIKAGGRYENHKNKGISHFLEHLLFKGTREYSCRKIKESIEGVGGSLNGFTSEELTCYLVKIPGRYLDLALDILSSMVISPSLAATDVEKERGVILEEIKMYKDLPQAYVHELLDELLWPDQPLGLSIAGTFESVSGIKREDITSYKKGYYTPSNIVISAAGSLDSHKLTKRIEKISAGFRGENINKFVAAEEMQSKPALKILDKATEQTHLALGFHGFKREHPLKHALALLHVILGANMSSRLFNEVREKRALAYEIGTQVKRFQDTGAFIVHAGIDNSKVIKAIGVILKEIGRIKGALVTEDEFKRAKEFYLGQLMLALEDTLDHMLWIGESTSSTDKTHSLEEIIKEVNKLKRQDIQKAAADIFNEKNLNVALIGPLKQSQRNIYNQLRID